MYLSSRFGGYCKEENYCNAARLLSSHVSLGNLRDSRRLSLKSERGPHPSHQLLTAHFAISSHEVKH